MKTKIYRLSVTTQGPTYPPSEILDADGNFVVIGIINRDSDGVCQSCWGSAIVSVDSFMPQFGENAPYTIIREFDWENIQDHEDCVLYTLPLPLPCNNYPMKFAPQQNPAISRQKSYPLHEAPIPDVREIDGRKISMPIYLSDWVKAKGILKVTINDEQTGADFDFDFQDLVPNSLYTIMALREYDLNPLKGPTRPGPLGVPNVMITDCNGSGNYHAHMPNPFPEKGNRIINIVLLYMSTQMNYGGAIGHYGLGGDIHAQMKLPGKYFQEFETRNKNALN